MLSDEWAEEIDTESARGNKCGMQSIRKLAATMARLAGRNQDEIDVRGRWRNTQRVSDRYTSICLPFIDAIVASSLCVGGPCKYEAKEGSNVNDRWLTTEFAPHIAAKMGTAIGILLGKALLWCLMDPTMTLIIPVELRNRLKVRYNTIQALEENANPIERIGLYVRNNNGQLVIDLVIPQANGEA